MSVLVGKPAPVIALPDSNGDIFTLTPGQGKPIVLFFYPKSGSWGCTREVCQFRDAVAEKPPFDVSNAQVIGVSPDSVASQKAFVERYRINYPILSDEQGDARRTYGIGKALMGWSPAARTTFIIDSNGTIRDSLDTTINYHAHSKFVSKWLDQLEAETRVAKSEVARVVPKLYPKSVPAPATTKTPPVAGHTTTDFPSVRLVS